MKFILTLIATLLFSLPAVASDLGDDGLHKAPWMRDTFKDMGEDLAEATAEGKRLMVIIEQRGCVYCAKMHKEVFSRPEVADYITENFFVVQLNMFGDVEVTDFDGNSLPEKNMVKKWGMLFTPTILFFPEIVEDDISAPAATVAVMPGAFSHNTTLHMFNWVIEKGYDGEESFQKYHARKLAEAPEK
jgi:thioredoxin-related protein